MTPEMQKFVDQAILIIEEFTPLDPFQISLAAIHEVVFVMGTGTSAALEQAIAEQSPHAARFAGQAEVISALLAVFQSLEAGFIAQDQSYNLISDIEDVLGDAV
jgi:hypothetical protein